MPTLDDIFQRGQSVPLLELKQYLAGVQAGTGLDWALDNDDAVGRTLSAKLLEVLFVTPQDFGAVGDSAYDTVTGGATVGTDCSDAMKAFFDHCIATGAIGYIPAGYYAVAWGTLLFRNGHEKKAWPTILTAGRDNCWFIGTGSADAPMIEINNAYSDGTLTTEPDDETWLGGELGGFTAAPSSRTGSNTARHAIRLFGIEGMRLGGIVGYDLQGSTVHIPKHQVDTNVGGGAATNPDPFQVYGCQFDFIRAQRCDGRILFNENSLGLVQCKFGAIRGANTLAGGIYGVGAGNQFQALSMQSCKGWAIDDGMQTSDDGGVAHSFLLFTAEIDDSEYGIRINKMTGGQILDCRIIHRYNYLSRPSLADQSDGAWPKTALDLGGGSLTPFIQQVHIGLRHRFDGGTGATLGNLGTVTDFHSKTTTYNDLEITIEYQDNASLGVTAATLISNYSGASNYVRVTSWGKPLIDSLLKRRSSATYTTNFTVPASSVINTSSAKVNLVNEQWDEGADFDAANEAFTVPWSGRARVTVVLPMGSASPSTLNAVMRVGYLLNRSGSYSGLYNRSISPTTGTCHYRFSQVIDVLAGDILYPQADCSAGALTMTALGQAFEAVFQVEML